MTADGVGGVWPYALDLASGFAARGIQTTIAVMGPGLVAHQSAEAAERGLDVIEGGFPLAWERVNPDAVHAAGPWLLGLERTLAPDVVHLNGYWHATLPWLAPAVVVGHSCVRSWWKAVHGIEAPGEWADYTARVAEGLQTAAAVVAPTAAMLDALRAEYGTLREGRVIPNALGSLRPPAHAVPKEPLVFSAGRIWDEAKNIEAVCAIAPSLSWPVVVAGDTANQKRQCVGTGYVRYVGRLPRDEVRRWYERASIYALPARYEPFGLSVLEAAAAGCALVLGDIRSLRENWQDAAVFVPPDNRRALAAAIQGLIDDPSQRQTLADAAARRARQFTPGKMVASYLDVYSGALARSRTLSR